MTFPLPHLAAITDLLIGADALSATVQLAAPEQASPPPRVWRWLRSRDGWDPVLPAAYHDGPTSLALDLPLLMASGPGRGGRPGTARVRGIHCS